MGISAENQKKIFTPFFTTKGAYSQNNSGLAGAGLGLSVTYQIIKSHKGTISFESDEGKGTTFIIILPMEEEYLPGKVKDYELLYNKNISDRAADLKILIVDDKKDVTGTLFDMLEVLGYKDITVLNSSGEVLPLIKKNKYDVLFLDIFMPDISGEKIFDELKDNEDLAIIILTGKIEDKSKYLNEKKAFGFVGKPFSLNDIFQILNKVVEDKVNRRN